MPRVVSFIVLLAVIILIGSMFFQVMVQFIVPLFLAAVLVVIFKPLHLWVVGKCGDRVRVAAALTTLLIVMIVLLPLSAMLVRAVSEAAVHYYEFNEDQVAAVAADDRPSAMSNAETNAADTNAAEAERADSNGEADASDPVASGDPQQNDLAAGATLSAAEQVESAVPQSGTTVDKNSLLAAVDSVIPKINEQLQKWNLPLLDAVQVRDYLRESFEQMAAPLALGGVRALVSTLFSLAIMVLTLYYFFADGPNMVVALMKLSPLDDEYEQELLDKFAAVSRSVVVAVLLSAIAQGVLAGIGYFFAGVNNVFLCTVLTAVFAMVPSWEPRSSGCPSVLCSTTSGRQPRRSCWPFTVVWWCRWSTI